VSTGGGGGCAGGPVIQGWVQRLAPGSARALLPSSSRLAITRVIHAWPPSLPAGTPGGAAGTGTGPEQPEGDQATGERPALGPAWPASPSCLQCSCHSFCCAAIDGKL
jgi:hypothetical protein